MNRYRFLVIIVACLSVLSTALRAQSYDTPEVWRFHESSIYYVTLQDANGRSINNQFAQTPRAIGAYVGGELRGVSEQITVNPSSGLTVFAIRVWGDSNDPETVDFRVRSNDLEYLLASRAFKGGEEENYGSASSPIIIKFVPVTQMRLSPSSVTVTVGKSLYLKPVLDPQDHSTLLTNLTYTFTATNHNGIFTVDNDGLIKGLASGQGSINVQAKDGNRTVFTASVAVSVLNATVGVTGIRNDLPSLQIKKNVGEEFQLAFTILPENATNHKVTYQLGDYDVLTYIEDERGVATFKGLKGGTTTITVISEDNTDVKLTYNVTIISNVTGINIDYSIYGGTFKANVGDTHIYERMAKMIRMIPADADDLTYTISLNDQSVVKLTGATTLTAVAKGTATVTVTANGSSDDPAASPVSKQVQIIVEDPPTQATIAQNTMYVLLASGAVQDISERVCKNVTLNGDAEFWTAAAGNVAATGKGVTVKNAHIGSTGIEGDFQATEAGTTTITINLSWADYDSWGVSSNTLQKKSSQSQFQIIVTEQAKLSGFDVAVTGAVAGETGTITFKPQPTGAAFDADNLKVTIKNASIPSSWSSQFTVTRKSVSTEQMVYEFSSSVPGNVTVTVVDGNNTTILLNDPTATTPNSFSGFEIGWPLSLSTGWQWRSNPCGKIATSDLETVFSTADLYEIRTKSDLLDNDPQWGFYGTLMNTTGLEPFQCYKIKMKNARNAVIYPSSAADATGTAAIGAELKLTLKPGWNWIGHPYFFDRMLRNVITTKVKELDGAVFVGKNGSAELDNGIWEGNTVMFEAGQGYLFKNPSSEDITITLPSEFATMTAGNEGPSSARSLTASIWKYDASQFMNNMTIVAVLDGIANPERYSIGAFVNNECRGEGEVIGGKAFITVHCIDGEQVTFRLYDQYRGTYSNVNEHLKARMRVGSLKAPFKLHIADGDTGIIDATNGMVSTDCYDLSGRQLQHTSRGISVQRTAASTYRKVVIK